MGNVETELAPEIAQAVMVEDDAASTIPEGIYRLPGEEITPCEQACLEGDKLWRLGVQAEEQGLLEECGFLYEEAHRSYIDAVWLDSAKNSQLDWIFYLKLASTEVGIAGHSNRDEDFFGFAEKSYAKARERIPKSISPEEAANIERIILSQTADLYIIEGIVDRRKQAHMLEEAKQVLEEAERVASAVPAAQDTLVTERLRIQRGIIGVIEGGRARIRGVSPQLGALLVDTEYKEHIAA